MKILTESTKIEYIDFGYLGETLCGFSEMYWPRNLICLSCVAAALVCFLLFFIRNVTDYYTLAFFEPRPGPGELAEFNHHGNVTSKFEAAVDTIATVSQTETKRTNKTSNIRSIQVGTREIKMNVNRHVHLLIVTSFGLEE